jgi:hypothetical protein
MKTKTLVIAIFTLILGLTVTVNGNTPHKETGSKTTTVEQSEFQASINILADDIVRFNVIMPKEDKVRLSAYSERGILIYSYILRKRNYARIGFDISMLSPGKYEYVIERNKEEVLRKTIEKK